MEIEVYRHLWIVKGSPHGNLSFGEQCFHSLNGLGADGRQLALAVNNYLMSLNLAPLGTSPLGRGDPINRDFFHCPISFEVLRDPVITRSCGHTFERRNIQNWIERYHNCPCCRLPLEANQLTPNLALKDAIETANAADWQRNPTETDAQYIERQANRHLGLLGEIRVSQIAQSYLKAQVRLLLNNYIDLRRQKAELQNTDDQRARENHALQGHNGRLSGENLSLQEERGRLQNTIAAQQSTIERQNRQINTLQSRVEALENENARLVRESATARQALQESQQNLQESQRNLQATVVQLNVVKAQLRNVENMGFMDGLRIAGATFFGDRQAIIQDILRR